jgi:ferredoxin
MDDPVQVSVDQNKCQGHAQCHSICPEVFGMDDSGYAVLDSPDVPPGREEAAEDAVLSCPEGALSMVK